MKIVAVDTSTLTGSIALVEDDRLIAEEVLSVATTHSERLISSLDTLLKASGMTIEEVDGFGVATGPGSFTGLRIGLAAVKGLAFPESKPVVGVSSLLTLAYNLYGASCPIASIIDAKRGEFYIGIYQFQKGRVKTLLKDTVVPPAVLLDRVTSFKGTVGFVGNGVSKLESKIKKKMGPRGIIPPPSFHAPRASHIAFLARAAIQKGHVDDLQALTPNYIRKSDAEIKK